MPALIFVPTPFALPDPRYGHMSVRHTLRTTTARRGWPEIQWIRPAAAISVAGVMQQFFFRLG